MRLLWLYSEARLRLKHWVLHHYGHIDEEPTLFAQRLLDVVQTKFNRHLYDGKVEGYGMVLYPRK